MAVARTHVWRRWRISRSLSPKFREFQALQCSWRRQLLQERIAGAIETDEKMATDLAGPGYHINRSNLLVLESKANMQKRGLASPDDGDALALTFAQARWRPAEKEERDEDE